MKITTFFIDKFKEVSIAAPNGNQEEGGVYGDESNYNKWILGQEGDTSDFEGVVNTNILFGDLYKITLDTGNFFNSPMPGGFPLINDFMNLELEFYWDFIQSNQFIFNNVSYGQFRTTWKPRGIQRPGTGGGGNVPDPFPTLIEYAMGVKERVGWVEVNRTRPSIYYELCSGGKRARSDHFYDIDKFIITAELFDPDNQRATQVYSYQNVNPYNGGNERYYTVNQFNTTLFAGGISETSRIGLAPIGNWFTWINNPQGHFRTYNNIPDNIGGYFDIFPWPRGPLWGQYSGMPKEYLPRLVTGNQLGLDASVTDGIRQIRLPIPNGIGPIIQDTPLLIATKTRDLNSPNSEKFTDESQTVKLSSDGSSFIQPIYSEDIWGEKRLSQNIQVGFRSNIRTPSFGGCQPVIGVDDGGTGGKKLAIDDSFGMKLYELEKQYVEKYSKYKWCPPRKKINNSFDISTPSPIRPTNNVVTRRTSGNSEEYSYVDNNSDINRIIKIGSFNPDQSLNFDLEEDKLFKGSDSAGKLGAIEINYERVTDGELENLTFRDENGNDETVSVLITGDKKEVDYFNDKDYYEKTKFISDINMLYNGTIETELGIRSSEQMLASNYDVPYGTYRIKQEILEGQPGQVINTTKIIQNGSDADPKEFSSAVNSVTKLAKTNTTYPEPIGVDASGMPIFARNTLESSIRKIKEDLTGIKEITFKGSDVKFGSVVLQKRIAADAAIRNFDRSRDIDLSTGIKRTIQYVNTGISTKGVVDLNTGKKLDKGNLYTHKIFNYISSNGSSKYAYPKNISKKLFFEEKEKNLKPGFIDFVGNYDEWDPSGTFWYLNTDDYTPKGAKHSLENITHIIVSKFDTLGEKKDYWGSTLELPQRTPIMNVKTGSLFFVPTAGPGTGQISVGKDQEYMFIINGQSEEYPLYYKIPVKFTPGIATESTSTITIPSRLNSRTSNQDDRIIFSVPSGLESMVGKNIIIEYNDRLSRFKDTNKMEGSVIIHNVNSGNVEVELTAITGSGTYSKWTIYRYTDYPKVPGEPDYYRFNHRPFIVKYSNDPKPKKQPSDLTVVPGADNTYAGWRFAGLWHRDGTWPIEHKNYSGLLGGTGNADNYWEPSMGGVNTGAWLKVPKRRVRLEYHSFGQHSEDAVMSYIHREWLKEKDRIFGIEQYEKSLKVQNYERIVSPYSDALYNQTYYDSNIVHPLNEKYQPDIENIKNWEPWEILLDSTRISMLDSLKDIKAKTLVIFLNDNNGDEERGVSSPIIPGAWNWGGTSRYFTSGDAPSNWKEGHIMEWWVVAHKITNDNTMEQKENYWQWWYPEPTEHTMGMFKTDEWYKAIFIKAITSPSNPTGKLTKKDAYKPNESNKKTFCDLLYLSEQLLKMHRARLLELNTYINKRSNFYGEKNDDGTYKNASFERSMRFVKGFKKFINLFKN